ncbi:HAMP domain-containing histidine kinase [Erysipelothrix sp. HDW6C]|uniref:sensor histidine kinase n=1 Tax=Erysipelothrix sp. HDW6C TaxID=2714930 RepID=UPI001407FDB6|nr:sensor histidine kinase [Erysipelothrix sp. HDW6C]QIK69773.1 HAMP domain-containing histidine kinase [Erysipelothrix sp. HDW6C]
MRIRDYLADKRYLILVALFLSVFLLFFLSVLKIQWEVTVMVLLSLWIATGTPLVVEFSRRRSFYNELLANLEALDQKYLITEMIPDPTFLDGMVLVEVLNDTNKSMADFVRTYKSSQDDYLSYLELWIHEVKTPLAAIDLIASNHRGLEMNAILEESARIQNYLEQVLFYARSSSVEKDYIVQKIDLGMHIRNVVKELSPIFIQKKVSLDMDGIDRDVYSDAKWLEFIIKQILDNALKYVEADTGSIEVKCFEQAQNIVLTIQDNGPGIPAQDIRRVFERGFTGQLGRNHKQATGMGLYLVKTLGDKLYMNISIASDSGTTVTLTFPKSDMMFR